MIDVSSLIADTDLGAQSYSILRSTGSFVKGRWTEVEEEIAGYGSVHVASQKDLNQFPEGDRIKGAMAFYSTQELFVTRTGDDPGTSDKCVWRNEEYKLVAVYPYVDFGFYKAIGVRIKGA